MPHKFVKFGEENPVICFMITPWLCTYIFMYAGNTQVVPQERIYLKAYKMQVYMYHAILKLNICSYDMIEF